MPMEVYVKNTRSKEWIYALLAQNTPVSFTAGGPSMNPTIRDGELVQIRPVQPKDLLRGAILLYRKHDQLILHRLIRINPGNGELLITGDSALEGLDRVRSEDILGIATAVQRAGQSIALNSPTSRLRGRFRYFQRPLRRLIRDHLQKNQAGTS